MFGKLREQYQKTIAPIGTVLAKTGISPNTITILSLLVALCSGYAYLVRNPAIGGVLIILAGLLDMFDGAIARATGKESKFGATFDHVIDRYAEFFIVFGIIAGGYTHWVSGLIMIFGMVMASFVRAKAESVGGLKNCSVGIAERQEKLLLLIGGSLSVPFFPEALNYSVILAGILSHITVVQRLHYTWTQIGGK